MLSEHVELTGFVQNNEATTSALKVKLHEEPCFYRNQNNITKMFLSPTSSQSCSRVNFVLERSERGASLS